MALHLKSDARYKGKNILIDGSNISIREWSDEFDQRNRDAGKRMVALAQELNALGVNPENFMESLGGESRSDSSAVGDRLSQMIDELDRLNREMTRETLVQCVAGWDLVDSEGQPIPVTLENLDDMPTYAKRKLVTECQKYNSLSEEEVGFFRAGSRPSGARPV